MRKNRFADNLRSCLVLIVLLSSLVGCSLDDVMYEDETKPYDVPDNVTNIHAIKFREYINKDVEAKKQFGEELLSNTPFYDMTGLQMTSMYGLCFTIPYGDNSYGTVNGAIYYPVEYKQSDDERVVLGEHLGVPHNINNETLNNEVEFKRRFLFSHYFYSLGEQDAAVDTSLLSYMYLLNNPVRYNKAGQNIVVNKSRNRSAGNNSFIIANVNMEITHCYNGYSSDGTIWGLTPQTVQRFVGVAADWTSSVRLINCTYQGSGQMSASIALEGVIDYYDGKISEFVNNIRLAANAEHWTLTIQYEYSYIFPSDGDDESDPNDGKLVGSGGAAEGGKTDPEFQEDAEEDCTKIRKSEQTKKFTRNMIDSLLLAENYKYWKTNLVSFQDFIDKVEENPKRECSATLEHLNDKFGLRDLQVFENFNAGSSITSTSLFNLHSHPSNTIPSPSPRDLKTLAYYGQDEAYEHYCGEMIFSGNGNDATIYFLMAGDKSVLGNLYDSIKDEIDENTNRFKEGGGCYKYLEKFQKSLKSLSNEEQLIMELILVADYFGGEDCMYLCKYSWNKNTNKNDGVLSTYGKKNVVKNNNIVTKLIKCE